MHSRARSYMGGPFRASLWPVPPHRLMFLKALFIPNSVRVAWLPIFGPMSFRANPSICLVRNALPCLAHLAYHVPAERDSIQPRSRIRRLTPTHVIHFDKGQHQGISSGGSERLSGILPLIASFQSMSR